MNQNYQNRRVTVRKIIPYVWLATALVLLVACSLLNREPQLGHVTPLVDEGVLTCSQECSQRGQCGTNAELGTVVLGGSVGPVVIGHDVFFLAGETVVINRSENRTLTPVIGGDSFEIPFYQVGAPAQSKTGWVAGWCLAAP